LSGGHGVMHPQPSKRHAQYLGDTPRGVLSQPDRHRDRAISQDVDLNLQIRNIMLTGKRLDGNSIGCYRGGQPGKITGLQQGASRTAQLTGQLIGRRWHSRGIISPIRERPQVIWSPHARTGTIRGTFPTAKWLSSDSGIGNPSNDVKVACFNLLGPGSDLFGIKQVYNRGGPVGYGIDV